MEPESYWWEGMGESEATQAGRGSDGVASPG